MLGLVFAEVTTKLVLAKGSKSCLGALINLFAFASPATFTTVEYRLPISSPFLTPGKGKSAGFADFGRF